MSQRGVQGPIGLSGMWFLSQTPAAKGDGGMHAVIEHGGNAAMTRLLLAGGTAAALMGAMLVLPVIVSGMEGRELTLLGIGVISAGCLLIAGGLVASWLGLRRRHTSLVPTGVRVTVAANVLFLVFFALELSDRLVRQDGRIMYWTTFLLLPATLLFWGLVGAMRWAWWTSRGAFALGTLWFLVWVAVIPFGNLQSEAGPVPWYGRVYMVVVSLAFASILGCAYWSLGRSDTRRYFGLARSQE